MSYDFAYSVRDDDTGAAYSHAEERTGNKTHGEYRVSLPDGRVQVVSYVADENGYQAKVSYEPASPPQEVHRALKYGPGSGKHRQFAPRTYRGRQRRPKIYKNPRTRPSNIHQGPEHSFLSEPFSSHISAREDESHLFETPPSYLPFSKKEDEASSLPLSKATDFYLPKSLSFYLPTPKEEDFYPQESSSSYFPTSKKKALDIPEASSSTFPQSTEEPNLHKHSLSSTSEPKSAYVTESTTPSHYLSPKTSSYYDPYATDSPSFPGPPVIAKLMDKVLETVQSPYNFSPYRNNTLEVTTYRPRHQNPDTFPSSSILSGKNSSPIFRTINQTTSSPLKLPEVTSYMPSRLSIPSPVSPARKLTEEENNTTQPFNTLSVNTASPTRSSLSHPLPPSYPLSSEILKSHSPHPSTAPPYYVSIPVPYTPAPSYRESSPLSNSPPQPPYFGPKYRSYFSGPSYPPRITGLPSRLSTIQIPLES